MRALIVIAFLFLQLTTFAQWTRKADIPTARCFLSSCTLDGKIYVIGGIESTSPTGPSVGTMEVYDPIQDTWDTTKAPMPTSRVEFGACAVIGKIYAIGGATNHGASPFGMVEEYDPLTNTWDTNKDTMPTPRKGAAYGVIDNKIYVAGGTEVANYTASNKLEVYDPATNTWIDTLETMLYAMYSPTGAVINDKFYVIGGLLGYPPWTGQTTVQMYDPTMDEWFHVADLDSGRVGHTTNGVAGKIYAIGGDRQPPIIRSVEEYDPNTNIWTRIDQTPFVWTGYTASVFENKIYLISGSTTSLMGGFTPTSTVYSFDPSYSLDTIYVPGDYATIQEAINAANNGNIVLVADGIYQENINYKGKAITVASHFLIDGNESHIENTIIDGSQPANPDTGSVVLFINGEDTTSVLCGFTITGGTGTLGTATTRAGGGIAVYLSGAKICNNIIEYNSVNHTSDYALGGGVYVGLNNDIAIVKNNIIRNNSVDGTYPFGGGISLSSIGLTYILSNKITDNEATGNSASGGGIDLWSSTDELIINSNFIKGNDTQLNGYGGGGIDLFNWGAPITVSNNLIVDNNARWGGGVLVDFPVSGYSKTANLKVKDFSWAKKEISLSKLLQDIPVFVNNTIINNYGTTGGGIHIRNSTPDVMNCIVWGNTYSSGGQIFGTATVTYSDVEGGYPGTGNIDSLPHFADLEYCLLDPTAPSPCIDAGNPDPMYNDVEDPNNPGYALYPAMGNLRNDMGTFGGPNSNWASVLSDTLYVPGDYVTIQEAINAANNGNIVLVADGTYLENINFSGKAITVASHFLVDGDTSHISNTIIDGSQPSHPDSGSVVSFVSGEDTTSVLCGFTIRGGTGTYSSYWDDRNGGGFYLDSSGAKINNNIIKSNSVVYNGYTYGGGIMAFSHGNHNIIIRDNLIDNNYLEGTDTFGAGIALWSDSYSLVSNNIISNNVHNSAYCQGGGIHMGPGNHQIINNYIFNNSALSQGSSGGGAGGIYLISYDNMNDKPLIANNLIVHNEGTEGGGIKVWTLTESSNRGLRVNKEAKINTIEKITYNPIIENNSILFNTAPGFGGGIRNGNNTPTTIINNIVWGNDGYSTYDQIHGTAQSVTYCNVQGGYAGTGNIDEDPMFDDNTFYCINQHSPCVDAGNPDAMYNDVEDPQNLGYALLPARGTLVNDMGHFGGPSSLWSTWDIPVSVKDDDGEIGIPSEYILSQNYPNPFNPTTTIKYGLRERTMVELRVFDILGRKVISLVNEEQPAGYYELEFNANRLASGIYFYRMQAVPIGRQTGSFVETKKMVLVK